MSRAGLGYLPARRADRPETLYWSLAISAVLHALAIFVLRVGIGGPPPAYAAPVINVEMALLEAIDEVVADPWPDSGEALEDFGSLAEAFAAAPEITFGDSPDGVETPGQGDLARAGRSDLAPTPLSRKDADRLSEHDFSPGLRPRRIRRLDANSDLKTLETLYLNRWQRKVESVGVLFFANELVQLKGELRVLVRMEPSGRVRDIRVWDDGDNPQLAKAARRILREASPFPPLPDALAAQTDLLEIYRIWVFRGDAEAP